MQFSAGFAVIDNGGCTSLLRRVFDVHLQEMTTDGFIDATWDKYLANNKQQDCITAPSGQTFVSLLHDYLLPLRRRESQACNAGRVTILTHGDIQARRHECYPKT